MHLTMLAGKAAILAPEMQVNLDNLLCLWNSIFIQEVAIALNGMMTRERDLLIFMCTKTEPSRTIGTKKERDFFVQMRISAMIMLLRKRTSRVRKSQLFLR